VETASGDGTKVAYVECWMLFDGSNCIVVEDTTDDCSDNDTADNDLMTK